MEEEAFKFLSVVLVLRVAMELMEEERRPWAAMRDLFYIILLFSLLGRA